MTQTEFTFAKDIDKIANVIQTIEEKIRKTESIRIKETDYNVKNELAAYENGLEYALKILKKI